MWPALAIHTDARMRAASIAEALVEHRRTGLCVKVHDKDRILQGPQPAGERRYQNLVDFPTRVKSWPPKT